MDPGREQRKLIVVPFKFRARILLAYHDDPTAGHRHFTVTLAKIKKKFYWPGVNKDVKTYCEGCRPCKLVKSTKQKTGLLGDFGLRPNLFEVIHIDFVGPLPLTVDGNRAIFTIIDRCSGLLEAVAVPDMTGKTAAKILWKYWISRFGVPVAIISDNGPAFESGLVKKEISEKFGIQMIHCSRYHPSSNGAIERQHRTLKSNLLLYTTKTSRWDITIDAFVFTVRNTVRDKEGYSPSFLAFGTELRVPSDLLNQKITWTDTESYVSRRLFEVAIANKLVTQRRRARWELNQKNHDEKYRETKFQVGDEVFLRRPNKPVGVPGKLWVRNEGPYKVTKILGSGQTYQIDRNGSLESWNAEHLFMQSLPSQSLERTSLICEDDGKEREVDEMIRQREKRRESKKKSDVIRPRKPLKLAPIPRKEKWHSSDMRLGEFYIIQREDTRFLVRLNLIDGNTFWGQIWRPVGDPKNHDGRFLPVWYHEDTIVERWAEIPGARELSWDTDFFLPDIYLSFRELDHGRLPGEVREKWKKEYGNKIICS